MKTIVQFAGIVASHEAHLAQTPDDVPPEKAAGCGPPGHRGSAWQPTRWAPQLPAKPGEGIASRSGQLPQKGRSRSLPLVRRLSS